MATRKFFRAGRAPVSGLSDLHTGNLTGLRKAFSDAGLSEGTSALNRIKGDFAKFSDLNGADIRKVIEMSPGIERTRMLREITTGLQDFANSTDSRLANAGRKLRRFLEGPIGNALILGSAVGFIPWIVDSKKQEAYMAEQEEKAKADRAKYDEQAKAGEESGKALVGALQGINSMFLWLAIGGGILLIVMIAFMAMSSDSGSPPKPGGGDIF